MKKSILLIVIALIGCSKDDSGPNCCQTVFKDGIQYVIEQCDQSTLERTKQFATHKELSLMQESADCD